MIWGLSILETYDMIHIVLNSYIDVPSKKKKYFSVVKHILQENIVNHV